ncbi:MAG: 2,3-bisphosphoglycerate-independent phosphoglycerate mutase [Bacteroidota bacterium]
MNKLGLIILDGWGIAPDSMGNAISQANIPFFRKLMRDYPSSTLATSGEDVGLPEGQMGNSEVGHLNIGAGRVVWQDLAVINKSIRENTLENNEQIINLIKTAKRTHCKVHLMGLVSDGGVHSHLNHLKYITSVLHHHEVTNVYIHAFTDGRDTNPTNGINYLKDLDHHLSNTTGKIASITGRYYAMDRDKRWERIKIAYDALVHGIGDKETNWFNAISASYIQNVTDEFIKPIVITNNDGTPLSTIEENDIVFCFNFRTDRCREITQVLTQEEMPDFGMKTIPLYYVTMTRYDDNYKNVKVVFEKDNLNNTLGEVLEQQGKSQIRAAETEKYPHVTFFFSGGRELPFENEKRLLVASPKVATYDLQPEMSADEVKNLVLDEIKKEYADFICLNFANADMVGHTGVISAAIRAVEKVDRCLSEIIPIGIQHGYEFIIIADHGNADKMLNEDGSPNTAHTLNPVPVIYIGDKSKKVRNGRLADVAPTILNLMGITIPKEMTGENLIQ